MTNGKIQELRDGMLMWLEFDLDLINRPYNNRVAYFGCLVILVLEELER